MQKRASVHFTCGDDIVAESAFFKKTATATNLDESPNFSRSLRRTTTHIQLGADPLNTSQSSPQRKLTPPPILRGLSRLSLREAPGFPDHPDGMGTVVTEPSPVASVPSPRRHTHFVSPTAGDDSKTDAFSIVLKQ